MNFYVYILQSEKDGSYYKGFSENYEQRFIDHNLGKSKYTSGKRPWKLVYVEEFTNKSDALQREKNLKQAARIRINALIILDKNLLNKK